MSDKSHYAHDNNYSNWRKWNGGACPVHKDTMVEVKMTDGGWRGHADQFNWSHDATLRIVSYRIINQTYR